MRPSRLVPLLLLLGSTSILAACQATPAGNKASQSTDAPSAAEPGTSYANPIVLDGVTDEGSGVHAEHVYTDKHFPGYRWSSQALANKDGKIYDVIELVKGGETRTIYFDITDWFGKM